MRIPRPLCLSALFFAALLALPSVQAQRERLPYDDLLIVEQRWPNAKKTATGIRYVVDQPGHGLPANAGDLVSVIYEGTLLNGTRFDRNMNRDHAFRFRVGRGIVIQGWDQILQRMTEGERCTVIIPSELAYGSKGEAPNIPRDATLVFTMELVKIEREN